MAERQRLATEQAQQQAEKQRRELDARWGGGSSAHGSEEGFWDQMGSSGAVKKASNGLGASSPASTDMRRPAVASKAQANE